MIPHAVSNAMAVKVGYSNGCGNYADLKRYSFAGMFICVGVMSLSAILVGTFPEFLSGLFSTDKELIMVCIPVVYVLSFFQVFDGLQVALAGIFKGIKQTSVVMYSNIISYWIIAFPLGCILGLHYRLNLLGFWYALSFSALILCSIMLCVLHNKFKNYV